MVKGSSPIKELSDVTGGLIGGQSPPRYDKLESPSQREQGPALARRWWKEATLLGSLILIAVVVVAVTVTVVPKHGSGKALPQIGGTQPASEPATEPATGPAPDTSTSISAACNNSIYLETCISALSAYPGASTASVKDLVGIGLQIAKENATAGWKAALEFLSRGPDAGSPLSLGAIQDCYEEMQMSLENVNRSITVYQSLSADTNLLDGQIGDMQTYLSAGLTGLTTCSESLLETDLNAKEQFKVLSKSAVETMSISLTVVNYWQTTLDSYGHNRRLLSWSSAGLGIDLRNSKRSKGQDILETLVSAKNLEAAGSGPRKSVRCVLNCFRADPVCGEDGVTYWCGAADAECSGVEVAHVGFCNIENGGAGGKGSRAGQSLLLVHLVWLFLAGLLVLVELP